MYYADIVAVFCTILSVSAIHLLLKIRTAI